MILPSFFRRSAPAATIPNLYGMIVTQARLPAFYRELAVPDTVDGRFELIVLHVFLLVRRLGELGERELGQQVFDLFCRDMDQNLREMGVGDLKVPQEMRRIGEAYYGRALAYETAFAAQEPSALTRALVRNIYSAGDAKPSAVQRLATYMRTAAEQLSKQHVAALKRGTALFPEP